MNRNDPQWRIVQALLAGNPVPQSVPLQMRAPVESAMNAAYLSDSISRQNADSAILSGELSKPQFRGSAEENLTNDRMNYLSAAYPRRPVEKMKRSEMPNFMTREEFFRQQSAPLQGGAGQDMVRGQAAGDTLAPSPEELAKLAEGAGFDPNSLVGLDLNATEAKNLGLALRMMQAESTMRPLEHLGTKFKERALEWLPGEVLENKIYGSGALGTDPRYQQYRNARDSFANAALRADTGATINESELPEIIRESMPLPGDTDETVALKQRTREARIRALIAGTGPAAELLPQPGQPIISPNQMSDDEFRAWLEGQ